LLEKLVGHRLFHNQPLVQFALATFLPKIKNYLRNLLCFVRVNELLQAEITEVNANLVAIRDQANYLTENDLAFLF
jgi:hypothetical protein